MVCQWAAQPQQGGFAGGEDSGKPHPPECGVQAKASVCKCFMLVPETWPPVLRDFSYHFLTLGFPAKFHTRASLNPVYNRMVVLWGKTCRGCFYHHSTGPFLSILSITSEEDSILYHCWGQHTAWSLLSSLSQLISTLYIDMSSPPFSW